MPDRKWLKPKSESLEDFAWFLVKLTIFIALAVFALRYAVAADLRDPPWESVVRLR